MLYTHHDWQVVQILHVGAEGPRKMRLKHEVQDLFYVSEIEFENRPNGIYDVLQSLRNDPTSLDDLRWEEFLAVGWSVLQGRGYEVNRWRLITERPGIFRAIGFNAATELGSIIECDTTGLPLNLDGVRDLREVASQVRREGDTVTVITRALSPPARFLSFSLRSPVELIDRETIVSWANAVVADKTYDFYSKYIHTVMSVGTIGLDNRPFGRIVLPPDFGMQSFAELSAALGVPSQHAKHLAEVNYFPFELVRQVSQQPELMHGLTPRMFEEFIAELLVRLQFEDVRLTRFVNDGGRDVLAIKRVHGIPIRFFFECKKYAEGNKVQIDTIRSLLGVVAHSNREANIGVLVTSSRFTKGSIELIASDARLDGKDFEGITAWLKSI